MANVIELEVHRKHSLGRRAFLLFLSRHIKPVIVLAALTGAAWYAERWAPAEYAPWVDYGVQMLGVFTLLILLAVLLWTWLEYRFYTYMFTDEAFIMTYGYIIRNEMAALYHQIQNVSIQRSPLDRVIGVSKIVIYMTGADRDESRNKIVLPAVGKRKAKLVQKELLVRARRHIGYGNPVATGENRSGEVFGLDR